MMRSDRRTVKSLSVILAAILTLCLFVPLYTSVAAEEKDEFPYGEDKIYCLQQINWHNHEIGSAEKASAVGQSGSATANEYTGYYVGPYGEVYKTKQINDTTLIFQSIALPIGMLEFEVPSQVMMYKLNYGGTGAISGPEDLSGSVITIGGAIYSWDFSKEAKEKNTTKTREYLDENGEKKQEKYVETTYTGPLITPTAHQFQIVSVETSFSGTQTRVERLKLPAIIKTINASAFADNPYIKEVYGAGIEEVSSKAFYNCKNLEKVDFPELRYVRDNAFYKCNHLGDLDFSNVLAVGKAAFFDCVQFTRVNFSTQVQQLEAQAFKQCTGITHIDIPEGISISTIPDECFYLCTSLKDVQLPSDIINIGQKAFYNCSSLRVLDFRNTNLDTVSAQAFWGCLHLSYVLLPKTLVTFKTDAFDNCPELRYVYFTHNVTSEQLKQIAKSDLSNCAITEIDKDGPALCYGDPAETVTEKIVTVHQETEFTIYDTVDVASVTINGTPAEDFKLNDAFTGYSVETVLVKITTEGEYKILATDILGNKSEYTVVYTKRVGDVDGNGVIEAADARLTLRAAVGLEKYPVGSAEFSRADFDGNKTITAADARCVLRVAVGLDPFDNGNK